MQNAVLADVHRHDDVRRPRRAPRDVGHLELAEHVVVAGVGVLTLEHLRPGRASGQSSEGTMRQARIGVLRLVSKEHG